MHRLVVVSALIVSAAVSPAHAADKSIEVANDEIYLNHRNGRFGSRLAIGYDATNKVVVIAPESADVTLTYWPEGGINGSCPSPTKQPIAAPQIKIEDVEEKRGINVRAGSPTGPVVDGEQKSLIKVDRLKVGFDYCYHLEIVSRPKLEKEQRTELKNAIVSAVKLLAEVLPTDTNANEPCRSVLARVDDAEATPKEIAALVACELGWPGNEWEVLIPGSNNRVGIQAALEHFMEKDKDLTGAFRKAWQKRVAANGERTTMLRFLGPDNDITNNLRAILDGWGDEPLLIYDPLEGIDGEADIRAKLLGDADAPHRKALSPAVVRERDALLAAVWEHRDDLQDTTKRTPLTGAKEQILTAVLQSASEPLRVKADKNVVALQRERLESNLDDGDEREEALKVLRAITHDWATLNPGGKPRPGVKEEHAIINRLLEAVDELRDTDKRWRSDQDASKKAVLDDASFTRFLENINSVTTITAVGGYQVAPTYLERFPFYVSADVGILFGFLQPKDADLRRTDVSTYVGFNVYLTAVDKDEELGLLFFNNNPWSLRTLLRRFAITAGLSLTDFQRSSDLGVGGVIGDQLFLFGGGLRVTDYFRASGGGFLYTQTSPSPLSDEESLRIAPYFGISVDLDAFGELKKLYDKAKAPD